MMKLIEVAQWTFTGESIWSHALGPVAQALQTDIPDDKMVGSLILHGFHFELHHISYLLFFFKRQIKCVTSN